MAPRMKVEVASSAASNAKGQAKPATSSVESTASAKAPKVSVQAPRAVVEPDVPAAPKAKAQVSSAKAKGPTKSPAKASSSAKPKAVVEPAPQPEQDWEPKAESRPQGQQDAGTQGQPGRIAGARTAATGWVHRTFPGHENAFWGGVIALVLALLVFAIGFWRVLLICLLVVVGVAIGQILDGDPKIIRTVRGLINSDRDTR